MMYLRAETEMRIAPLPASASVPIMAIESLDKPLTYEEERGKPMPSRNHAGIQVNLIVEFAKDREYRVYSELTLEFEGRPYTPDLSVYPKEELDLRHDLVKRTDAPLLVVEI